MPSMFTSGHLCTLPILEWRNAYTVASFCAQLAVTSEKKEKCPVHSLHPSVMQGTVFSHFLFETACTQPYCSLLGGSKRKEVGVQRVYFIEAEHVSSFFFHCKPSIIKPMEINCDVCSSLSPQDSLLTLSARRSFSSLAVSFVFK